MQTQVETQRKAQSLIPLQTVHYSKSMHKMFPRHVCVCEKGETERVSETTRHTERLGDMYGPQKHNGSLTDIFHNRASVSCVQSSLTGVERCNEEETWTFLFFSPPQARRITVLKKNESEPHRNSQRTNPSNRCHQKLSDWWEILREVSCIKHHGKDGEIKGRCEGGCLDIWSG